MSIHVFITRLFVASLFVTTLCLGGCAQHGEKPADVGSVLNDMSLVRDRSVSSISDYRIDGWRYIDRYNIVLTASHNENYLVSFMTPCLGINSAFAIGFTSTAGGVTEFDDIVVEGPGRRAEVCPIKEIVRLKDSEG